MWTNRLFRHGRASGGAIGFGPAPVQRTGHMSTTPAESGRPPAEVSDPSLRRIQGRGGVAPRTHECMIPQEDGCHLTGSARAIPVWGGLRVQPGPGTLPAGNDRRQDSNGHLVPIVRSPFERRIDDREVAHPWITRSCQPRTRRRRLAPIRRRRSLAVSPPGISYRVYISLNVQIIAA